MEKVKKCFLCGKELQLFKQENYDRQELGDYAFASRKIPEYMHWALYECRECRVLYSACPIKKNEIYEKYGNASYDSNNEANDASRTYMEYLKRYLPGFPQGRALDIGTGNGSYLKELKAGGGRDSDRSRTVDCPYQSGRQRDCNMHCQWSFFRKLI